MSTACSLFAVSLYQPPSGQQQQQQVAEKLANLKLKEGGEGERGGLADADAAVKETPPLGEISQESGLEKYAKLFHKTSVKDVLDAGKRLAQAADGDQDDDDVLMTAVVGGWVKTGRVQGGGSFAFIELNDGSSPLNLQVLVNENVVADAKNTAGVAQLSAITTTGTSLVVRGALKRTPKGTKQLVELKASDILFCGACDGAVYPIAKKKTSFEFLRSHLHLRARTNTISAIARVRNALSLATHLFFQQNGFLYVHTPIIGTSDAEGAGEAFQVTTLPLAADAVVREPMLTEEEMAALVARQSAKGGEVKDAKTAAKEDPKDEDAKALVKVKVSELMELKQQVEKAKHRQQHPDGFKRTKDGLIDYNEDFFGLKSFLCVSGQLQGEAYACAMSKIYTFGPTFRAENSHTTRHAAEFWMIEPEIAFADLEDVMCCAEDYVRFCCKYLLDHCADDMAFFSKMIDKKAVSRVRTVADSRFARCSYTEAIEILQVEAKKRKGKKKFQNEIFWGCDMASEHEKFLAEEHFKCPTIVYNYPKEIKSFYMKLNEDGKTVAAMDVLVPGVGELIGGSQREENYDVLTQKMETAGLPVEEYEWYLDLRKFGTVPHGGFGLGFERLIMFTTGIENIRETIPFPRWPGNAHG
jgi:asparaginyl-tRNA synthetase